MALKIFSIVANILFVLFFFGLCIFLHELGHLLVALWRGLHVERFSVGFGKKIWGKTYKNVEYIVSILPFGGYVALPQLDPTDEPKKADGKELPHASPSSRMLTAAAGPVANLIFGFFLGLFIWWIGVYKPAPANHCDVISVPRILALYKDGLRSKDHVVAIDGKAVSGKWKELAQTLPQQDGVTLRVKRDENELDLHYTPTANTEYEAGLRPDDRIIAVNGKALSRGWEQLSNTITLAPGKVMLNVQRDGQDLEFSYKPAPNPDTEGLGYPFFRVQTPTVVAEVVPGSPAQAAGLKSGDKILAIDGESIRDADTFIDKIRESGGASLTLLVERGNKEITISNLKARGEMVEGKILYRIGAAIPPTSRVLTHPNPWKQFVNVFSQTRDTLRSLFAKGSLVKPRHMSGPVGILQIIWMKVAIGGFREGLSFIILITFSLAFFNLLPIPVLDGGHIVFALVEMVIRRRVPTRFAYWLQTAFAVLLITFMLYVTFYDVKRSMKLWQMFHPSSTEEPATPPAK